MCKSEQISLFSSNTINPTSSNDDFESSATETGNVENLLPFEIGERVRVVVNAKEKDDPESYYYLKEFEGKRGVVKKVIPNPSLYYEVEIGNRIAVVYHYELLPGWLK